MPQPLKPTALLEFQKGKLYSDQRDRAELEPKPIRNLQPRCPKRFNKQQRSIWKNIAVQLKNLGLFIGANSMQMELLTDVYDQYLISCFALTEKTKNQLFVANNSGGFKENPILGTQRNFRAEILRILAELGLGSTALTRMGSFALKVKKEKAGLENLLD